MRFEKEAHLWTVDDVYSGQECEEIVAYIEKSAPALASANTGYRNQDRLMVDDSQTADDLFERLKPHLPASIGPFSLVGLNNRLRYYRYSEGQQFTPHMDHWYRPSANRITLHTVLIYFNGDFDGGETRFTEQVDELIVPRTGLAAIFQHKIRHEGCPVRSGVKYAMRTDVVYEAPSEIGKVSLPPL
jgi:prolyl 4-hydroxylase